jgi:hypothetical protein
MKFSFEAVASGQQLSNQGTGGRSPSQYVVESPFLFPWMAVVSAKLANLVLVVNQVF